MTDISLVRGDTLRLNIDSIKRTDGTLYTLAESDIVKMDIKKYQNDKTPIISKSATAADYIDGRLLIVITPADTADKSIGEYWFDVRLIISEAEIYTIIPASKFRIVQNITDVKGGG